MWSKKHDRFCLENKITPSAQLLWRWLMGEGQPGDRIEIDLKLEFNAWVAKHRVQGAFSNPTLKSALSQLEELGIVVIERTYTWSIHAVVYRALNWLKKEDPVEKEIYTESPPMPQFVKDKIEQQQQELEVRNELKSWGIEYRDRDWKAIIIHGVENVKSALQHLLIRATSTEITNPAGWFKRCLQNQWWQDNRSPLSLSLSQLAYGGL
jgi:DNA-binding HxlR family transcriptional regulator